MPTQLADDAWARLVDNIKLLPETSPNVAHFASLLAEIKKAKSKKKYHNEKISKLAEKVVDSQTTAMQGMATAMESQKTLLTKVSPDIFTTPGKKRPAAEGLGGDAKRVKTEGGTPTTPKGRRNSEEELLPRHKGRLSANGHTLNKLLTPVSQTIA